MGNTVTVHYIGTLDNGRIFDQADADTPRTFTLGAEEVFPSLEKAICGMAVGEVKNIHLPAEKAFGPRRKENIVAVKRELFPAGREIRVGQKLEVSFAVGEQRIMRVLEADEEKVVLDGNHALAGCDLTFALKVVEVK
jgi:FKBP-type peptidyl-prolyl cis-trans isomerase 2